MSKLKMALITVFTLTLSVILVGCGCQNKETYTVTFDSNGGTKVKAQEVIANEKVKKPDEPTKKGYKFIGWYLDGKKYDFSKKVTKDLTLRAKWSKEEVYLDDDVTFDDYIKPTLTSNKDLSINNLETAKSELKDFDVTYANPVLQTTLVNGKCGVEWKDSYKLEYITRDLKDYQVDLNATITCGSRSEDVLVKATIKASPYTYTATKQGENGLITILKVDGARYYILTSDKTSAVYLDEAAGVQVLTKLHSDATNYTMQFFDDYNTRYIVKGSVQND